jgi:hypothetical protein
VMVVWMLGIGSKAVAVTTLLVGYKGFVLVRACLHCVRHGVVTVFTYCWTSSIARCVFRSWSACTGDIVELHVGSPLASHARVREAVRVCSVFASSLGDRDQFDKAVRCQ